MTYQIPGQLFILFALATNLVAGFAFLMLSRGKLNWESLAKRSYALFTVFAGFALAYLFYLFFSHNYAFKYVYQYSQKTQPFFYVLSAVWGGQEGTYLLWLFLNAIFGYIIIKKGGEYRNYAMVVYSVINLFFLLILTRLSPFALLPFSAENGLGLNPLLRDPWMVIHPPVVFVGYAMASVPFAIVVAALFKNDYSRVNRLIFPWVAITALMLAAGNILGGFWAYKTLGWGGYWGWDPVENSSFIPWMISLSLLHGLLIEKRSGALRRTNMLLSMFIFLLVIYGTFLTRSGVLSDFSVHSFTDLGVNVFLIGFMIFFLVLSLVVFGYRAASIPSEPMRYNVFGRDFSLFAGMVLLFIIGVVTLFWTSLPLTTTAFTSQPRAADVATYNGFALPLAIIVSFFLTLAPFARFAEFQSMNWQRRLLATLAITLLIGVGFFHFVLGAGAMFVVLFILVVTGTVMYLSHPELVRSLIPSLAVFAATIAVTLAVGVHNYLYILFFATAAMAATSNVIAVVKRLPDRWQVIGGQLTHFGFGLMLIGILASSAFVTARKVVIPLGGDKEAFGIDVAYNGMENAITYPNNRLLLTLHEGNKAIPARPEMYYSERMDGLMRKPFIERRATKDLYFSPEQIKESESHDQLTISKGQTVPTGQFDLTFTGFTMNQHGETGSGGVTVAANLQLSTGDTAIQASPALSQESGPDGNSWLVDKPAHVTVGGTKYDISISHILADQGAVVLSIPQLASAAQPEQLVLDVSRIPLINLVWIGAILIMLGTLLTFLRRRAELYQQAAPEAETRHTAPSPTRS